MNTVETVPKVLVLDDESNIRLSIQSCLEDHGFLVKTFCDPVKAYQELLNRAYDIVLLDIKLKNISGIQFFEKMLSEKIDTPVIFISGNATLHEAASTIQKGACDFLEKPFSSEKLLLTIKNCLEYQRLKQKVNELSELEPKVNLVGDDIKILALKNDIAKVSTTDATVYISGESGTGKELIAHLIHAQSSRSKARFIKVNCSAIPDSLIESELFGYMKGAFTGAESSKKGLFELAHNGTIFLDEIGDMSLQAQAKVLRALQSKEIQRLGSETVSSINVRVIAASHKDLKVLIKSGQFREDLFYRINVIPLISIPLREHRDDIPTLVSYYLHQLCDKHGFKSKQIQPDCLKILKQYSWPGNVRELINVIERLVIMSEDIIRSSDLPYEISNSEQLIASEQVLSFRAFKESSEKRFLSECLKQNGGNISNTAKALEMDRSYLHKKLTQYGISKADFFE